MQSFHYVEGRLFAEDVEVKKLCQVIGTPFYCYSSSLIESQFLAFYRDLAEKEPAMVWRHLGRPSIFQLEEQVQGNGLGFE